MSILKRILSFIYPLTRRIQSLHNGTLELTLTNGRKVLNAAHVNYSYGSLQRVLKFALRRLYLFGTRKTLVLGLGGGSVLETLRKDFHYSGKITAVDIDPVVIGVAANEFEIVEDERTKIVCADAKEFLEKDPGRYDLVIVDLFIDNVVPKEFLSPEFWRSVLDHLNAHGKIIFNTLCTPPSDLGPLEEKLRRRGIDFFVYRHVESTNKVLVAENR